MCNSNYFISRKPELHEELYKIAAEEIKRAVCGEIDMLNRLNIKGDILIFVPGYSEIARLR